MGAQLLANAAGGDVEILKYGSPRRALPEIGWSQIFIDKSNKDFEELFEDPFHVLHWHGDRILLPSFSFHYFSRISTDINAKPLY